MKNKVCHDVIILSCRKFYTSVYFFYLIKNILLLVTKKAIASHEKIHSFAVGYSYFEGLIRFTSQKMSKYYFYKNVYYKVVKVVQETKPFIASLSLKD
jgi:hypothetical protein